MGYKDIRDRLKKISEYILVPIIVLFNTLGLSPNTVTIIGLLINILGAWFIAKGMFITAGLTILFAGIFDMLDGALARKMGKKTRFGGFLDSTTDRISESALYLGLILYYLNAGKNGLVVLSYVALCLSFLISYIRARAGALGIDCEGGIFTRTERIVTLILGLLFSRLFDSVFYGLVIITFFSAITVAQRICIVYDRGCKARQNKKKGIRLKPDKSDVK
jgi:CDP-diacylglycerol--glycerol-3-phosphate 3-phosphatidyltransferase